MLSAEARTSTLSKDSRRGKRDRRIRSGNRPGSATLRRIRLYWAEIRRRDGSRMDLRGENEPLWATICSSAEGNYAILSTIATKEFVIKIHVKQQPLFLQFPRWNFSRSSTDAARTRMVCLMSLNYFGTDPGNADSDGDGIRTELVEAAQIRSRLAVQK